MVKFFSLNQSLPIVKNIFHLTFVKNYGAIWGILAGQRGIFILAGIIILVAVSYYQRRLAQDKNQQFLQIALGLIAGGVGGNLYDRIFYGAVIDFFDFRVWPVFNLADALTDAGILMIIWACWKKPNKGA